MAYTIEQANALLTSINTEAGLRSLIAQLDVGATGSGHDSVQRADRRWDFLDGCRQRMVKGVSFAYFSEEPSCHVAHALN